MRQKQSGCVQQILGGLVCLVLIVALPGIGFILGPIAYVVIGHTQERGMCQGEPT